MNTLKLLNIVLAATYFQVQYDVIYVSVSIDFSAAVQRAANHMFRMQSKATPPRIIRYVRVTTGFFSLATASKRCLCLWR